MFLKPVDVGVSQNEFCHAAYCTIFPRSKNCDVLCSSEKFAISFWALDALIEWYAAGHMVAEPEHKRRSAQLYDLGQGELDGCGVALTHERRR